MIREISLKEIPIFHGSSGRTPRLSMCAILPDSPRANLWSSSGGLCSSSEACEATTKRFTLSCFCGSKKYYFVWDGLYFKTHFLYNRDHGTRQAANKFLELLNLHRQSIRSTFVLDTIIAGTQSFCHFASAGDTPLASPGRSELMISSVLNHNQPKAIAVCQLVSSYACNRHATSRCLLLSATLHHTLGLWTATRNPVLSTFTTYLCQADRNVSPMQCHIFTTRCPANTSVPASPRARVFADAQRCSVKTESNVCQKFSCISDRMKSHAIHCFPISPCLATHLWVHQVRP